MLTLIKRSGGLLKEYESNLMILFSRFERRMVELEQVLNEKVAEIEDLQVIEIKPLVINIYLSVYKCNWLHQTTYTQR